MDIFRENFITNDYIVEVLVERKLKKNNFANKYEIKLLNLLEMSHWYSHMTFIY